MNKALRLALVLCCGCTTPPAEGPAPAPDTISGDEVQDLLGRERPEMETHAIAAADGFFSARVEGVTPPEVEKHEHGYYLAWDIGTRAPLECTIFAEGKDLAASTVGVSEVFFEEAAAAFGALEARAVAGVDAGAFGPHPFIRVDWVYRTNREGEKLAGLFKILFADVGEVTAQCMHNEIGYRETFARISRSLVESLETRVEPQGEVFYTDVYLASINGQRIGVMRRQFAHDRDGDVGLEIKGATLFPARGEIAGTLDMFGHEFSTPEGELLGSVRVAVEDGELSTNLKLQRTEGGGWSATGVHRGAEIREAFDSPEPLAGELAQIHTLRSALAGGATRVELTHYSPSRALDAATALTFTLTGREGDDYLGTMSEGGEDSQVRIDTAGTVTRQESELGGATLVLERIHQAGGI